MHRMRVSVAHSGPDHAAARVAAAQYGLVTRAQLLDLGLKRGAVARRLQAGRLHRVHEGVYAVGHQAPRREARWLAAVLACGEGAALSHRSAATLWAIREGEGPRPDVSIPARSGRRQPAIAVHRVGLEPRDVTRHRAIPVTSVARTLVDLAHEVEHAQLVRALREAQFRKLFDLAATREALARRPSRSLRLLLDDLVVTQTRIEDRLLEICDRRGIPRPATQRPIAGRRVDFVWEEARLVVETDGWEAHGTRDAFQVDRAATNALQLAGYTVLRFTHADLVRRPARVAREIRAALVRAGAP